MKYDSNLDDYSYLRLRRAPPRPSGLSIVRAVDLFSGCGGLSLGIVEACRQLGKQFLSVAALDHNLDCLRVYEKNIPCRRTQCKDVNSVLDGVLGTQVTHAEHAFLKEIGEVTIMLAGPPCEGFSDLNNYTRRNDSRNALYERAVRFVEIARPGHVIIENVPQVRHGHNGEVWRAIETIRRLGYNVEGDVVRLDALGVPQSRRRHVVVASLSKTLSIQEVVRKYHVDRERSVWWAIHDLEDKPPEGVFDTPSRLTKTNESRVKYLHKNNVYDLPDRLRPACHKDGNHSYRSSYGRILKDKPAQTLTSGFGCPGQGRFVHPTRLRTLTPHEAARIQFFPDYFDFSPVNGRGVLAKMISNAAPMKLSYVFGYELLS